VTPVVVPNAESTFWYHAGQGHSGSNGRRLRSKLYASASQLVEQIAEDVLSDRDQEIINGLRRLSELRARREVAVLGYNAYRKGRIPWGLLPRGWKLRAQKYRIGHELDRHIETLLRDLLLYPILPRM
jgi:hypothetical protein